MSKVQGDLKNGTVINPVVGKTKTDVLARLKQAFIDLRVNVPAQWCRILEGEKPIEEFLDHLLEILWFC